MSKWSGKGRLDSNYSLARLSCESGLFNAGLFFLSKGDTLLFIILILLNSQRYSESIAE